MNPGKSIRMNSILNPADGRTVVVALDHGGVAGPLEGIEEPVRVFNECVDGGADALLATRGFVKATAGLWRRSTSLILKLTGGFTVLGGTFEEELISSPEAALFFGASAAAVTVKFGHPREGEFIRQASLTADACVRGGLPLLVEVLPSAADGKNNTAGAERLAARAAQEIGADLVKIAYNGDPDGFHRLVKGCPAPVLILGGERKKNLEDLFTAIHEALDAGAAGVAMGRSLWQQGRTQAMVEAVVGLVHKSWSVKQALAHLGK
jgi:DhnA family fructose-bisphosphate aldolase class Ia